MGEVREGERNKKIGPGERSSKGTPTKVKVVSKIVINRTI